MAELHVVNLKHPKAIGAPLIPSPPFLFLELVDCARLFCRQRGRGEVVVIPL